MVDSDNAGSGEDRGGAAAVVYPAIMFGSDESYGRRLADKRENETGITSEEPMRDKGREPIHNQTHLDSALHGGY